MPLPIVDTTSTVFTTVGYLCLLLGVIFLAFYLLRRIGFHGLARQGGPSAPTLVGRLMLAQRQALVVVRYRDKDLLLGVTENRISLLDKEEAGEELPEPVKNMNFASLLKRSTDNDG